MYSFLSTYSRAFCTSMFNLAEWWWPLWAMCWFVGLVCCFWCPCWFCLNSEGSWNLMPKIKSFRRENSKHKTDLHLGAVVHQGDRLGLEYQRPKMPGEKGFWRTWWWFVSCCSCKITDVRVTDVSRAVRATNTTYYTWRLAINAGNCDNTFPPWKKGCVTISYRIPTHLDPYSL